MSCILSVKLGFSVFAYVVATSIAYIGAYRVGVNYGMVSDNIPPPDQVIKMCKSRNIQRLRLFEPNPGALAALSSSGIEVILGTRNEDLPKLAADPSYAKTWVETHVMPHIHTTLFKYISAGNEVIPGELANYVLPEMKNLDAALKAVGRKIPVSTTVPSNVLGISYPPSAGKFSSVTAPVMEPIVAFLAAESYPLLVNVYPYFACIGNPKDISLDYALFNSKKVVVRDGALGYKNLFDAMVDAVYAALEKAGGSTVRIVVSETGWPSAGGDGLVATINNAQTYNRNLISHLALSPGTPRRPRQDLETYIFALFNEDLKAVGTERNFGLFYPNMTEVYGVSLEAPFFSGVRPIGRENHEIKVFKLGQNSNLLKGYFCNLIIYNLNSTKLAYTMKVTEKCDVYSFGTNAYNGFVND